MNKSMSVLAAACLLAACGQSEVQQDGVVMAAAQAPAAAMATAVADNFAAVDGERIIAEADSGENWLTHGRSYSEQRFSPLEQINQDNVSELGLAWYADLSTNRGQESTPLVIDGVIYVSEAWSKVSAYDARSGEQLWHYDPEVPGEWAVNACCDVVNRGVAAWEGKIYVGTIDGRLIALDAASGEEIWDIMTVPEGAPYAITGAPRAAKGRIYMGNGGAEFGVRGFVAAYDADTGERDWIWYSVPGNPADGFEQAELEWAAETWNGEFWRTGAGGTIWDAIVYDPVTDLLYVGTGNGSPWPSEIRSPGGGDNLFLSSIVALDPDTGEYVWHYQTTPADSWDYTATQPIMTADLEIDGENRHVVMQQPKNGFFYVLDARTGELLSAENVVPVTWASGVDLATGRPIENPEARYDRTGEGAIVSPFFGGSHNWHPMAFHPDTGLVYIPVADRNYGFVATEEDDNPMGQKLSISTVRGAQLFEQLGVEPVNENYLLAWDPVRQEAAWRVAYGNQRAGGTLATAGNLVFQGNQSDNTFRAFRADTGEELWRTGVQTGALAGPVTYLVDGEQYVAVVAGFRATRSYYEPNYSRLLVFKLGGSALLPAEESFPAPVLNPPADFGDAQLWAHGEDLYETYCGACHGIDGQARGAFPDLRFSPALNSQALFDAIVLEGARSANGMVAFDEVLNEADSEALRAYMTRRANQMLQAQQGQ